MYQSITCHKYRNILDRDWLVSASPGPCYLSSFILYTAPLHHGSLGSSHRGLLLLQHCQPRSLPRAWPRTVPIHGTLSLQISTQGCLLPFQSQIQCPLFRKPIPDPLSHLYHLPVSVYPLILFYFLSGTYDYMKLSYVYFLKCFFTCIFSDVQLDKSCYNLWHTLIIGPYMTQFYLMSFF